MKIIHQINKWSFIITLLLYLTLYLGMIAQIPLGLIQITLASFMLYKWKHFIPKHKKKLLLYWLIILLYIPFFFIGINNLDYGWIAITVIPMCIASYFVYTTHLLNSTNFDIKKPLDDENGNPIS